VVVIGGKGVMTGGDEMMGSNPGGVSFGSRPPANGNRDPLDEPKYISIPSEFRIAVAAL
jgi:hypothetical protein